MDRFEHEGKTYVAQEVDGSSCDGCAFDHLWTCATIRNCSIGPSLIIWVEEVKK